MFSILHPYLCLFAIVVFCRWRLHFERSGDQEIISVVDRQLTVSMRATMYPRSVPIEISVLHKIGNLVKRHMCTEMYNLMESK